MCGLKWLRCIVVSIKKQFSENLLFSRLNLSDQVNLALKDLGFVNCSPIQAKSLPHSLRGHDVIGKAQTGTGKTAAFLIAVIEDLMREEVAEERYGGEARALILAPTRELVMQIASDAKLLSKYTDLSVHTLVGGADYARQLKKLHADFVDILVATPGRLLDFCEKREVFLDQVQIMVIDEADRMLDMGFIPQVKRIIRLTPKKQHRQTLLFSATFPDDVAHLADQWTVEPSRIEIEPESVATDTVDQRVYLVTSDEKPVLLSNLLKNPDVNSLIVFANRRDQCRDLYNYLSKKGFSVGLLSGDIPQNRRTRTLDDFKKGKILTLVATDVAGRGIHIDDVSHVVNYTLPEEPEDYVHRIGRTGRAGQSGQSISFACEDDSFKLPEIEALLGKKILCEQPPADLLKE